MTPRLMLALAALLPVLGWAQSVSLHGLLGRQALLIVDGKPPRAVAPGQTHLGVTVLSTDEDRAVLALAGGQRLTLRVGESPVSVGGAPAPGGSDRVALSADARGHFITPGSINNRPTQFLVDTGASVVAILRDRELITNPEPTAILRANDLMGLVGNEEKLNAAQKVLAMSGDGIRQASRHST